MQTRTFIAAALAVGMMTAVSHAENDPSTKAAAAAEASENTEKKTFGDLMKQILRAGQDSKVEESAEEKAASLDRMTTGSVGSAGKSGRPYDTIISRYAAEYGVPAALAHAVVRIESNYRASARGRAGEVGLMQIKPATARGMGYSGSVKALYSPETNIKYGMKYLARAYQLGGGSTCGAILRYNAGHGAKRMNPISSAYCAKVKRILAGG